MISPGDVVKRRLCIAGVCPFWHFGILIAPNQVVHMLPECITRETLAGFAQGQVVELAFRPASPDRTIQRALQRVGQCGSFHALHNNCSSFADWCAERPPRSPAEMLAHAAEPRSPAEKSPPKGR